MWLPSTAECDVIATPLQFFNNVTLQCGFVGSDLFDQRIGGLVMTFSSLSFTERTLVGKESLEGKKVRTIVANHLKVDVKRVTAEAHFLDDLGADWLDRLELMMLMEDQFTRVEITDDDADQMEVVGDLIRYIEDANVGPDRLEG
jgi:acyl carrier protein